MNKGEEKIVWIASYPKSGNTWVRTLLANLYSSSDKPININDLNQTNSSSRSLFDEATGISSSDLSHKEIENLRPEVYKNIAVEAKDLVFLKVHDMWNVNTLGKPIFPKEVTKGVLYIIRNPLDIVISFAHHSSKPLEKMILQLNDKNASFCSDPNKQFNQFLQHISDWSSHVVSWIDHSGLPLLLVKYEDLIQNTQKELQLITKFLDINKTKQKIESSVKFSDIKLLSEMEKRDGFREKPIKMESFFRAGRSGDWGKHLSSDMVNRIISNHYEIMNRFGYL